MIKWCIILANWYNKILSNLPEVKGPFKGRKLSFKEKIKWTTLVLVAFFLLGVVPLFGLGANALSQFEFLSVVLGASFGSLITLGIGPIVMASIVLQLLVGSGILKKDLQKTEDKAWFQGTQKLLTYAFIIVEAVIYVALGGLSPEAGVSSMVLITQLIIGGLLIVFMDDIISKWGFGSGVSLFIAAGVSQQIFTQALSPLKNGESFVGAIPHLFQALSQGALVDVQVTILSIIATVGIFMLVVFAQAMKVEIPLSFGRVRGHGVRWPLNFIYTNVIPIILVSALVSNLQLLGGLFGNGFVDKVLPFLTNNNLLTHLFSGSATPVMFIQAGTYILFYMLLAAVFSWFWMQTSGLDPKSQSKQMMGSGLSIPGFRKDKRTLERLLKRYIYPLTIMSGLFIGFLAATADMTGAFGTGTGLLLTVMIIYKLYQDIGKEQLGDINPAMAKLLKR